MLLAVLCTYKAIHFGNDFQTVDGLALDGERTGVAMLENKKKGTRSGRESKSRKQVWRQIYNARSFMDVLLLDAMSLPISTFGSPRRVECTEGLRHPQVPRSDLSQTPSY